MSSCKSLHCCFHNNQEFFADTWQANLICERFMVVADGDPLMGHAIALCVHHVTYLSVR